MQNCALWAYRDDRAEREQTSIKLLLNRSLTTVSPSLRDMADWADRDREKTFSKCFIN